MTHPNEPRPSDLDQYINSLVEMLRAKYDYADKNRLNPNHKDENKRVVRFRHNKYTFGQWMMRGGKRSEATQKSTIEIPYTTLYECMANQTIPKEIKELL